MNSVGTLPLAYLKNTEEYKAKAAYTNALGIFEQYAIKAEAKERTELVFQPYLPLLNVTAQRGEIELLISRKEYAKAGMKSAELIKLLIQGLRYYQTYDWLLLRSIVSFGYLGWIAYSTLFIIKSYSIDNMAPINGGNRGLLIDLATILIFAGLSTLLYYKDSPITYYFYTVFPILFWSYTAKEWNIIPGLIRNMYPSKANKDTVIHTALYLISLEILVLSYFYRELLSLCLLLMGFAWPLTMPEEFRNRHFIILRSWRMLCLITSIFTLLPVELEENVWLIVAGGVLIVMSAVLAVILVPRYIHAALPTNQKTGMDMNIVWFQIGIIITSLVVVCHTSWSLAAKQGLPILNAAMSWLILIICIAIPIVDRLSGSKHYLRRLVIVYVSFAPVFILLSVSFETLFYCFYSLVVFVWMLLEQQLFFFERKSFNGKTYWVCEELLKIGHFK